MPITIGSNIASIKAQRRLSESSNELSTVYERLSSGQRINHASDDAAGLSISESLKSDTRVFSQGVRNLNDGISLLTIADSAIESLSNIVMRLKELSEQSSNGVYSLNQRNAIDKEAQALSKEYTRISQSTKFNGRNLFDGGLGTLRLQGGYGTTGGIAQDLGGAIGTGSFASALTSAFTITAETGSAGGDLNGDGIADLVEFGRTGATGNILVGLGRGDGTFGPFQTLTDTTPYLSYSLGDVNGDGTLDIVTISTSGTANVRTGRGDGSFSAGTTFSTSPVSQMVLSDFDNDGILDMFTLGTAGTLFRKGTGNGTFSSGVTVASDGYAAFADFNGDGIKDEISYGSNYNGVDDDPLITIRLGAGNGTFGSSQTIATDPTGPSGPFAAYSSFIGVTIGDFNGDGALDIVGQAFDSGYGVATQIMLGRGNGTFQTGISTGLTQGNGSNLLANADLNGDGILDLVSGATFQLGNGNGTFQASLSVAGTPTSILLGDFNADGVMDIGAGSTTGFKSFLQSTRSGVSPLLPFDLTSLSGSRQALSVFGKKLEQLSFQRSVVGAFQSRTQVAINVLTSSSENYAAAEGRIRNADVAEESSKLMRLNILQKASASVLAQANLQPKLALDLLKGGGK